MPGSGSTPGQAFSFAGGRDTRAARDAGASASATAHDFLRRGLLLPPDLPVTGGQQTVSAAACGRAGAAVVVENFEKICHGPGAAAARWAALGSQMMVDAQLLNVLRGAEKQREIEKKRGYTPPVFRHKKG